MTNLRTIGNRTSSLPSEFKQTHKEFRDNGMRSETVPIHSLGFECLSQLGRTLLIIDCDNITNSLRHAGWRAEFPELLNRIECLSESLEPHVFATAKVQAIDRVKAHFARAGILPHVGFVGINWTDKGPSRHANCDNQLLLQLSCLCTGQTYNTVVLATGKGVLGCAAIKFLAELRHPPRTYTFSVTDATSARSLTENNPLVNGNLWIGSDMLRVKAGLIQSGLLH